MAFYDIFEKLCLQKGISPTSAARKNGLTQQAVSHWKKRGSTPKAETVQKLANYFGVSVDYLLGKSELTDEEFSGDAKKGRDTAQSLLENSPFNVGDSFYDGSLVVRKVSERPDGTFEITFKADGKAVGAKKIKQLIDFINENNIEVDGILNLLQVARKIASDSGTSIKEGEESAVDPQEND